MRRPRLDVEACHLAKVAGTCNHHPLASEKHTPAFAESALEMISLHTQLLAVNPVLTNRSLAGLKGPTILDHRKVHR